MKSGLKNNSLIRAPYIFYGTSKGVYGRILETGKISVELRDRISDCFFRLGDDGVIDIPNGTDKIWFGSPLNNSNGLTHYLLGTFHQRGPVDRGAPFHGLLLSKDLLSQFGYKLNFIIDEWNRFTQQDDGLPRSRGKWEYEFPVMTKQREKEVYRRPEIGSLMEKLKKGQTTSVIDFSFTDIQDFFTELSFRSDLIDTFFWRWPPLGIQLISSDVSYRSTGRSETIEVRNRRQTSPLRGKEYTKKKRPFWLYAIMIVFAVLAIVFVIGDQLKINKHENEIISALSPASNKPLPILVKSTVDASNYLSENNNSKNREKIAYLLNLKAPSIHEKILQRVNQDWKWLFVDPMADKWYHFLKSSKHLKQKDSLFEEFLMLSQKRIRTVLVKYESNKNFDLGDLETVVNGCNSIVEITPLCEQSHALLAFIEMFGSLKGNEGSVDNIRRVDSFIGNYPNCEYRAKAEELLKKSVDFFYKRHLKIYETQRNPSRESINKLHEVSDHCTELIDIRKISALKELTDQKAQWFDIFLRISEESDVKKAIGMTEAFINNHKKSPFKLEAMKLVEKLYVKWRNQEWEKLVDKYNRMLDKGNIIEFMTIVGDFNNFEKRFQHIISEWTFSDLFSKLQLNLNDLKKGKRLTIKFKVKYIDPSLNNGENYQLRIWDGRETLRVPSSLKTGSAFIWGIWASPKTKPYVELDISQHPRTRKYIVRIGKTFLGEILQTREKQKSDKWFQGLLQRNKDETKRIEFRFAESKQPIVELEYKLPSRKDIGLVHINNFNIEQQEKVEESQPSLKD